MRSMLALNLMFVLSVLNIASAKANTVLKCGPQRVEPWPRNARVELISSGEALKLNVSTQYYGVKFETEYAVTQNGNQLVGEGIKLTIGATTTNGRLARLESEKDGAQDLICR